MNAGHDVLNHDQGEPNRGSGLYVDVENFQFDCQAMIQSLVENWPTGAPTPSRLTLYVRADQVELWRLWASSRFCDLDVAVHGTQHFSMSSSKNSADIAIATNAMADLILKRITHVTVFSDDSDFISLYAAIRDEPDIQLADGRVPFLWVMTDREGSLSTTVRQFFPREQLHTVAIERSDAQNTEPSESPNTKPVQSHPERPKDVWAEMAQSVLRDMPVGPFKSTDCQPVIERHWPKHPLARAGGSPFGIEFKNNIWPVLEKLGVKIRNPGKKPVQYEMTAEAKNALA